MDNLDVLDWLEQHNILPPQKVVNDAMIMGDLKRITWLEKRNILPDQDSTNTAAGLGRFNVVQFMERRNILPNQHGAYICALYKQYDILHWLEQRNIRPPHHEQPKPLSISRRIENIYGYVYDYSCTYNYIIHKRIFIIITSPVIFDTLSYSYSIFSICTYLFLMINCF